MRKLAWLALLALAACGSRDAFRADCQKAVAAKLSAPKTASYGNALDVAPPGQGEALRRISEDGAFGDERERYWFGYVDAENAFGTEVRMYFICRATGSGTTAALTDSLEELLDRF